MNSKSELRGEWEEVMERIRGEGMKGYEGYEGNERMPWEDIVREKSQGSERHNGRQERRKIISKK